MSLCLHRPRPVARKFSVLLPPLFLDGPANEVVERARLRCRAARGRLRRSLHGGGGRRRGGWLALRDDGGGFRRRRSRVNHRRRPRGRGRSRGHWERGDRNDWKLGRRCHDAPHLCGFGPRRRRRGSFRRRRHACGRLNETPGPGHREREDFARATQGDPRPLGQVTGKLTADPRGCRRQLEGERLSLHEARCSRAGREHQKRPGPEARPGRDDLFLDVSVSPKRRRSPREVLQRRSGRRRRNGCRDSMRRQGRGPARRTRRAPLQRGAARCILRTQVGRRLDLYVDCIAA